MVTIIRNAEIDDLRQLDNTILLTYKGVTGELGFQSDIEGKRVLLRLVQNAFYISLSNVQIVDEENFNNILTHITKDKYGILIHEPNRQFISLLDELPMYFRKKLINDMKRRKGVHCEDVLIPAWFTMICSSDQLFESVNWLITNCRFVSIWPKYWGAYGDHCHLVSQDIDTLIKQLPIFLSE